MIKTKYTGISEEIKKQIKAGEYGKHLPGIHQLGSKFNVSHITIMKAVKCLVADGVITPDGKRGNLINYRKNLHSKTNNVVIFCHSEFPDLKNDLMLKELNKKIKLDGYRPIYMNTPSLDIFNDESFWLSNKVDGFIFAYCSFDKNFAHLLKRNNVPFVAGNRMLENDGVNWVDFNIEKTLDKVISALHKSGRRKIMAAYPVTKTLNEHIFYMERIIQDIVKSHNNEFSVELIGIDGEELEERSLNCVKKFASSEADGLILISDFLPVLVKDELEKRSIHFPEDYTLVYRDKKAAPGSEDIPLILMPYKNLASEIWNLLKKIVEIPDIETQNVIVDESISLK